MLGPKNARENKMLKDISLASRLSNGSIDQIKADFFFMRMQTRQDRVDGCGAVEELAAVGEGLEVGCNDISVWVLGFELLSRGSRVGG